MAEQKDTAQESPQELPHVLTSQEAAQIIYDGFNLARGDNMVSHALYYLIGMHFNLDASKLDQQDLMKGIRQAYGHRMGAEIHPRIEPQEVKDNSRDDVREFLDGVQAHEGVEQESGLIREFINRMAETDMFFMTDTEANPGPKSRANTSRLCEVILGAGDPPHYDPEVLEHASPYTKRVIERIRAYATTQTFNGWTDDVHTFLVAAEGKATKVHSRKMAMDEMRLVKDTVGAYNVRYPQAKAQYPLAVRQAFPQATGK